MSTIAIWFDGGDVHGFGNVRRCRELAARLNRRGHRVVLFPLTERAAQLAQVEFAATAPPAEIVVLDLPYAGDEVLANARRTGARVLALDYAGEQAPDLTISLQAIRPLPIGAPHRVGVEYAIIRDEFRTLAQRSPAATGEEVLVVVGGGDTDGMSARIVRRLAPAVKQLTVVVGPLGAVELPESPPVKLLPQPADLAQRMQDCAWAVTTGGTTMLEFLALGKAVHVLPRTAAETTFAQRFLQLDALLGLGWETLGRPTAARIEACGRRGRDLVDGRGCERIAELLEDWA